MTPEVLDAGVALYRRALEKEEVRGAVLLVARRGKVVLHEAIGWRDADRKLPMEPDTLFRMASNTKPVIATAILMLAEEEKLSLEDYVRKHLPPWDNYRAGSIKIKHLLSHTSGLRISQIFLKPLLSHPSLTEESARFGLIGAEEAPGETYSYSNPGFNTLGAIVEIVSGKPLEVFLRERIYKPLGMKASWHHETAAPNDRMSVVYTKEDNGKWSVKWKPGDPADYPFVRASGGMISSAADYVRFCQMFLDGGRLNRVRILSEKSVKAATMQAPNAEQSDGRGYGFGWAVNNDGVYSHGGSDGTFAWVDPNAEVVGLVLTQSRRGKNPRDQFMKVVKAAVAD